MPQLFVTPRGDTMGLPALQEAQRQQRKNEILGEPEPAARLGTSPAGSQLGTLGLYETRTY